MLSVRSKAAGWLIAPATIIIATLVWWLYNADPLRLYLASAIYFIAVSLPGRIILQRLLPSIDLLRSWVFGSIFAEIILGVVLKLSDASLISGLILPIAAIAVWIRRDVEKSSNEEFSRAHQAIICATVLAFLSLFLYGQAYDTGSFFHLSYNPMVDLSYFQTVLTSISNYGSSRDLAQLGYHFNYPDLGYQVFSFIHRLSGAEAFDTLFFFAPFKDFLLLSLGVYCLIEDRVEKKWLAVVAAIGFYIFNSRSLLELNVPITNPAYRQGLYVLFFMLWAYGRGQAKEKWPLFVIGMIGLVLVKPAIWLVAAPALLMAQIIASFRSKSLSDLLLLIFSFAIAGSLFLVLFSPSQSGLASGHYTIIFGEGLRKTIDALAKISGSINALKEIVVRPLTDLSLSAVLIALLLFIPYVLQQLQHSGRLIALAIGLRGSKLGMLGSQLLWLVLICFAILAFVGMEYTSFLHVYLTPLLLTATTILLAISYRNGRSRLLLASQVLLLCADLAFAGWGYHNERSRRASAEVPSALVRELRQVSALTDTASVLAVYETGLFQPHDERSYLASAFTERKVLSEGAIYGSLIMGYHENLRDTKRSAIRDTLLTRRAARDSIYLSLDTLMVRSAAMKYGVSHILIRHGLGERITSPIGDTIFHGRMLTLLKL